jgi:hypothetical protein
MIFCGNWLDEEGTEMMCFDWSTLDVDANKEFA